jgi:hypothetical protein
MARSSVSDADYHYLKLTNQFISMITWTHAHPELLVEGCSASWFDYELTMSVQRDVTYELINNSFTASLIIAATFFDGTNWYFFRFLSLLI